MDNEKQQNVKEKTKMEPRDKKTLAIVGSIGGFIVVCFTASMIVGPNFKGTGGPYANWYNANAGYYDSNNQYIKMESSPFGLSKDGDGYAISLISQVPEEAKVLALPSNASDAFITKVLDQTSINVFQKEDVKIEKVYAPRTYQAIGENAFASLKNLTTYSHGYEPEAFLKIGKSAFEGDVALNDVYLPPSLGELGAASFKGCVSLSEMDLSKCILNAIAPSSFEGATSLSEIKLPATLYKIEESAFKDTAIASFRFSSSLEYLGANAFENCRSLIAADLSLTKLSTIKEAVFAGDNALNSISLPSSIAKIEANAFSGVSATKLSFKGTVEAWNAIEKDASWASSSSLSSIECSDGTVSI